MQSAEKYRGTAAIALLAFLATAGIATPSLAIDQEESLESIIAQAQEAVGGTHVASPLLETDQGVSASTTNVDVKVPQDGNGPVTVTAQGKDLAILMPSMFGDERVELLRGGVAAIGDVSDSVAGTIEATKNGVRLSTVINDSAAPTEYEYTFGNGVSPVILHDGSALLVEDRGGESIGRVAAPWAVDAEGMRYLHTSSSSKMCLFRSSNTGGQPIPSSQTLRCL